MAIPRHVAFIVGGSATYVQTAGVSLDAAYERKFDVVLETLERCIARNVPITSFLLLPREIEKYGDYPRVVQGVERFLARLAHWPGLATYKVRIKVMGHWYNLPGTLVDAVKDVLERTKDNDGFFCNIFLNYDGRQEIVDAVRLLGRKMLAAELDPQVVSAEHVREALYSNVVPPDIIIKTGMSHSLRGFLLWDSPEAELHMTGRPWQEFDAAQLDTAIAVWNRSRQ